ncbi:hypothetical protein D5018_21450, partial [Parashewanella curva]
MNQVMTIKLNAPVNTTGGTWTYDVTLLQPVDHVDPLTEDAISPLFSVIVTDSENNVDTGSFFVAFEDDSAADFIVPAVDVLELNALPGEAIGQAAGELGIQWGGDGAGSLILQPTTESGIKTVDGQNISFVLVGNVISGTAADGTEIFTFELNQSTNNWDFVQYHPIQAPSDGDLDFHFTIVDGDGDRSTGHITINPLINHDIDAVDDSYNVPEDGSVTLDLLANDIAPDGGKSIVSINGITLTGSAQTIAVTNGNVLIAADGTITFEPVGDYNGEV